MQKKYRFNNIPIHGAKNAALPLISATLLEKGLYRFYHVPKTTDIAEQVSLLRQFHVDASWENKTDSYTLFIDTRHMKIPDSLSLTSDIRASYYFIGATLSYDVDHIGFPCGNGCSIDKNNRKIDYHEELIALAGKKTTLQNNQLFVTGACIHQNIEYTFSKPSVGATMNAMMMFCKIDGCHRFYNYAKDPYISHLAGFINRLYGSDTIVVVNDCLCIRTKRDSTKPLFLLYKIIPDPIESITYVVFAAMCLQNNTTSSYTIGPMDHKHFGDIFSLLKNMGIDLVSSKKKRFYYVKRGTLRSFTFKTGYYPGMYTDCQPLFAALALSANIECTIEETIWNNRFHYAQAMQQCGYNIENISDTTIHIPMQTQNKELNNLDTQDIQCTDLRGGMALYMLLFQQYKKPSVLQKKHYIDRGYVDYENALSTIANEELVIYNRYNTSGLTNIGIGGTCSYFARFRSTKDVQCLLTFCQARKLPWYVIGGGNNVFFEKHVYGMLLKNEITGKINTSTWGAGTLLSVMVSLLAKEGNDVSSLAGIPGTLGGAVVGNAGAYGLEMKDIVHSCTFLRGNKIETRTHSEMGFAYRSSLCKKQHPRTDILLYVTIDNTLLETRSVSEIEKRMVEVLQKREITLPYKNTLGSVFKNPIAEGEKIYVWQLLEKLGLRGQIIRNIRLEQSHPNIFTNQERKANTDDLQYVLEYIQTQVYETFGIVLEKEIELIR